MSSNQHRKKRRRRQRSITIRDGEHVCIDGPANVREYRVRGKGRRKRLVVVAPATTKVRRGKRG